MTQDIVERLRSQSHLTQGDGLNALLATSDEAANLIEQLRAENERMRKAQGIFQSRVKPWMDACFGAEISSDRLERNDRFIEEAVELVQSGNYPKDRVLALVDYVYDRPIGEVKQEVGGVMVTLAAYCLAHDIDMHDCGEVELARIWTKVEQIRAKQAAKPTGSALPIALAAQQKEVG